MLPRGTPVLLAAPRNRGLPSYARVVRTVTSRTVQVVITADSGGRRKGALYTFPRAALERRSRGRHRREKPMRRRWRPLFLNFGNS
jgi:hypothetical protein